MFTSSYATRDSPCHFIASYLSRFSLSEVQSIGAAVGAAAATALTEAAGQQELFW